MAHRYRDAAGAYQFIRIEEYERTHGDSTHKYKHALCKNHANGKDITFNDAQAEGLLEQWIRDAADLETANDEARLQFLDPEVLPT